MPQLHAGKEYTAQTTAQLEPQSVNKRPRLLLPCPSAVMRDMLSLPLQLLQNAPATSVYNRDHSTACPPGYES